MQEQGIVFSTQRNITCGPELRRRCVTLRHARTQVTNLIGFRELISSIRALTLSLSDVRSRHLTLRYVMRKHGTLPGQTLSTYPPLYVHPR